jgi:tRNA(adenine34) deaminase
MLIFTHKIIFMFTHEYFMREALKEAQNAFDKDEVPVGAVVVVQNMIIAKAHNLTETLRDITAHAEMQAITAATGYLGGKYLEQCTLYVTLEPCPMCAGALFWAQLGQLVYGSSDDKRGFSLLNSPILHPKTQIISGILQNESTHLLKTFFSGKRK